MSDNSHHSARPSYKDAADLVKNRSSPRLCTPVEMTSEGTRNGGERGRLILLQKGVDFRLNNRMIRNDTIGRSVNWSTPIEGVRLAMLMVPDADFIVPVDDVSLSPDVMHLAATREPPRNRATARAASFARRCFLIWSF